MEPLQGVPSNLKDPLKLEEPKYTKLIQISTKWTHISENNKLSSISLFF